MLAVVPNEEEEELPNGESKDAGPCCRGSLRPQRITTVVPRVRATKVQAGSNWHSCAQMISEPASEHDDCEHDENQQEYG